MILYRYRGGDNTIKHNKRHSKLYYVWVKMKQRCYKEYDKGYKWYGQRGIKMCDEWKKDFQSFYTWAIDNGYKEGLSIDRINNDGNYEPNNCRWVTMKTQLRNTRHNAYYTINNETHCLSEWCEILDVKYNTVQARLRYGWTIEQALGLRKRGEKMSMEVRAQVRMSREELEELKEQANDNGLNISDYIRWLIANDAKGGEE